MLGYTPRERRDGPVRYENEICPGCSLLFGGTDDIVVCPECATPQHRACWLKNNRCVNAEKHAPGFVWTPLSAKPAGEAFDPAKDEGIICAVCGANNPKDALVCTGCGNPPQTPAPVPVLPQSQGNEPFAALSARGIDTEEEIGGVKSGDLLLYIQAGARSYISRFRSMESRAKKISWNWAAFFFAPYWFFYRKLFKPGAIFLGLTLALSLTFSAQMWSIYSNVSAMSAEIAQYGDPAQIPEKTLAALQDEVLKFAGIACVFLLPNTAAALCANWFYKKKSIEEIKSIRRHADSENVFRSITMRRGGVSPMAFAISYLGYSLVINLLTKLFSYV